MFDNNNDDNNFANFMSMIINVHHLRMHPLVFMSFYTCSVFLLLSNTPTLTLTGYVIFTLQDACT